MVIFNIPDIYGRFHLVNFDNVKAVSVSDSEECAIYFLNLMIAPEWQYRQDLIVNVRKKLTAKFVVLSGQNESAKRGVI